MPDSMPPSPQSDPLLWNAASTQFPSPESSNKRSPLSIAVTLGDWWLRLTSSGFSTVTATLAQRERERRSRLLSWLILGLLGGEIIVSPLAASDLRARATLLIWLVGLALVAVLNRFGHINWAGVVLVLLISGGLLEANLASPIGLTMGELPNFDAYVVAVVIAATVLPRWSVFFVAAGNSLLIVGDYLYQPHFTDLQQNVELYSSATSQTISLLVRPIALELFLAVVAYLWVRSVDVALRRADRAEEIASLQKRDLARTAALQEGVRQLLDTHVAVANGNFGARVPVLRDQLLWQVGVSLNLLIRRLQSFVDQLPRGERQNYQYTDWLAWRSAQEAELIASALRQAERGEQPRWPAPSGTPLDEVVELLQNPAVVASLQKERRRMTEPYT
ncbi:MAG: hypothetical protein ACLQUY_05760 [Ktedonobacterales bacterium]